MNCVNEKIIDSVIKKAERLCSDSLLLIGVYGSVATGDDYFKSDLDLLILISDDDGRKLSCGFILDDIGVGYDIYCTSWDMIKYDAKCNHAHLSKLFDSQIVYVKDKSALERLEKIKSDAKKLLYSEDRFIKANEALKNAKLSFAEGCLSDSVSVVRTSAAVTISYLLDAVMLFNSKYFRFGVKRTFDELEKLHLSSAFAHNICSVAKAKDIDEIRMLLKQLILYVEQYITVKHDKKKPSEDNISGTYEEMYSNWRNKVEQAAVEKDVFSSFMNLNSLQLMLHEIAEDVEIDDLEIMDLYNPDDLDNNVKVFDEALAKYKRVYETAKIKPKHYANIDEFVKGYLSEYK